MNWLEIVALISTIVCVVLSAKENILAWPIGIISALSLIGIYIPSSMYANICLQSIFVVQCSIGWYNWGSSNEVKPSKLEFNKVFYHVVAAFLLGWLYAKVNIYLNPTIKWYVVYLDGVSTFIALLGNWYLTKKILQAWPLFMTYNIIISSLLAYQGIYLLSILNICLLIISFNAYRTWKKNLELV